MSPSMRAEAGSMSAPAPRVTTLIFCLLIAGAASAATAPMVDSFTATPAAPVPGQTVVLRIAAHDPDCSAPPCATACGTAIRSDLLVWTDSTARTPSPFSGSVAQPTGSPWSASVNWIAPPAEGTYTVRANLVDNGGMLCGGRQTRVATLQVVVSSSPLPVIDSFTIAPTSVTAGATATLTASARDPLGRAMTYSFSADAGTIAHASPSASTATWTAPKSAGSVVLRCSISAGGTTASAQATANVEIGSYLKILAVESLRATRIAALPDGRMAVVDGVSGVLAVLHSSGSVSWRATGLQTPVGVAISGGEIYVLERGADRISVWSLGGNRLREMAIDGVLPSQLATGPNPGELVFSDTGAARVNVISAADGRMLRQIGVGTLQFPSGVATAGGKVAVADPGAGRVFLFDATGAAAGTIGDSTLFVRPQGIAWDPGNAAYFVADSFSGEISIVSAEGALRGSLGGFGTTPGRLVNPIDVAVLAGGVVAVAAGSGEVPLFGIVDTLPPLGGASNVVAGDRLNDDGGALTVTWTASPDLARVTTQRVERATDDNFEPAGTVAGNATSFTDLSARDGICYRYRVVVTDGTVETASSPSACAVARNDLAPPAPLLLTATAESPFAGTIDWTRSEAGDLSGYRVDVAGKSETTSATSLSLTSLEPGTSYEVSVRAFDVAGNESSAAIATLTTYADDPPAAPGPVEVTDTATGGVIEVRWTSPTTPTPIAKYRVAVTPDVSGWPASVVETSETSLRVTGLVNELEYGVTVTAVTPWDRVGEASPSAAVTPTAPRRVLPLVAETDEIVDASGAALEFEIASERRELRLQYRASSTALKVVIDGMLLATLSDTGGVWSDASLVVEKRFLKAAPPHRLELRSSAFADPTAQLSLRRVDFVPLVPKLVTWTGWNSVVDLTWQWDDGREDLGIALTRDGKPVTCSTPRLARCRDTFLENGKQVVWSLAATSSAGWTSDAVEIRGHAKFEPLPPPVTDVVVTAGTASWTPMSAAVTKSGPAVAVKTYRLYSAGTFLMEVPAPSASVPGVDPQTLVVRSVDAEGRESQ